MGYYDGRPEIYEQRGLVQLFKAYWYLGIICLLSMIAGIVFGVMATINTEEPAGLVVITLLGMVPFMITMKFFAVIENRKYKQSWKDLEAWENTPEKKQEKKEYAENSVIFHHAGYITGGMYMLKEQAPKYKDVKMLLCDEDNLLVVELTDEQKEKLQNGEKIELKLDSSDSLTLNGKFSKNTTKLYVAI